MEMETKASSFETNVMSNKERLRGGGTRLLDEEKFRKKFVIKYPQLLNKCITDSEIWEKKYILKFLFKCNQQYNTTGEIRLSEAALLVLESYKHISAGSRISKEKALSLSDVFNTSTNVNMNDVVDLVEVEQLSAVSSDSVSSDNIFNISKNTSLNQHLIETTPVSKIRKYSSGSSKYFGSGSSIDSRKSNQSSQSRSRSNSTTSTISTNSDEDINEGKKSNTKTKTKSTRRSKTTKATKATKTTKVVAKCNAVSVAKKTKVKKLSLENKKGPLSPVNRNVMKKRNAILKKKKSQNQIINDKSKSKSKSKRASLMLKSVVEQTFAAVNASVRSPNSPRVKKTIKMLNEVSQRRRMSENLGSGENDGNVDNNGSNSTPKKKKRRRRGTMREMFAMQKQ